MYSQQHYLAQQVETASPAQLVTMLYDGALAALTRARMTWDQPLEVNRELQRAQRILTELRVTLDYERGGEIAGNLGSLYVWMIDELIAANLDKDADRLDPVERTLKEIRAAWVEATHGNQAAAS